MAEQKHEHHGRSSKGLLDPTNILESLHLRIGDTFLDAGCGDGYFSLAASEFIGGEGRVYAVDNDEAAINHLRKEIANRDIVNIEPIVADITDKIPLPNEIIDTTLMANVLHGLVANDELDGAMKEINRVMKHGGKLLEHDAKFLVVEFKKDSPMGPPSNIKLSPEQVQDIMAIYGFKNPTVNDIGLYHYSILLTRE
ncbi:MAG TPA: class I SAM-dependent methyltransferase [Methanotrichaceae archaeon]|nr:class I SAM-dependent methyltransferase [Methanotrichaceae archaeon]